MKKILAFAAAGLLTVGFVGCNSKGASGSSETMDSLSIAFGDLYGAGMGQQLRSMDSTINIDQALRGMEYIANADTSKAFMQGLQMGMQIAQLYSGIEEQCGMPINKSLFMKHLREGLMKTTPMGQEEMMAMQSKIEPLLKKAMKELIVILCPFVPHIAEEMWQHIGGEGLASDQSWPVCDEKALVLDEVEIVIQINGKLKDKLTVSKDIDKSELEKIALESDKVKELTEGKTIVKVIAVPGRLVNLVVK